MEKLPEALSSKLESMSIEMHYQNKYPTNKLRNDDNYSFINF